MKFRMPTTEELIEEWKTEWDLQDLFNGGSYSLLSGSVYNNDPQRDIFLSIFDIFDEGSNDIFVKVETFKPQDKGLDGWYGTMEEIVATTKHMCKDPESLRKAFLDSEAELPYILVVRTLEGKYKTLGGRTRCGVANLLDMPVTALVFDQKGVGRLLLAIIKDLIRNNQLDSSLYDDVEIDTDDLFLRLENKDPYADHGFEDRRQCLYESLERLIRKYDLGG
jgi:hypothetical protein